MGKTIEIFLENGDPDNISTGKILGWSGKVTKVPRSEIRKCNKDEFSDPGIYFLFAKSENNGPDSVYIGQANNVKTRLINHLQDNFYWTTSIVATDKDLDKSMLLYMEHQAVSIAKSNRIYNVKTSRTDVNNKIADSRKDAADNFLQNLDLVIASMGYSVLRQAPMENQEEVVFYCKRNNSLARGQISENGFTVLEGSIASDHVTNSAYPWQKELRAELEKNGIIDGNRKFTKNFEFNTPRLAASVVSGASSNKNEWKTEEGIRLGEYEEQSFKN